MVQTYLVHSKSDPSIWRIITVWENQAALNAMRQSNETPRGVLIFRSAHAEPKLLIFDVVSQAVKQTA